MDVQNALRGVSALMVLFLSSGAGLAQVYHPPQGLPAYPGSPAPSATYAAPIDSHFDQLGASPTGTQIACGGTCGGCGAPGCASQGGFFGGADFLLIRPHFSEAIAFARGTLGANVQMAAEPLSFDYDGSLRAFVGYRGKGGDGELRFTYWHLQGDTAVGAGDLGAGQFIVDPFGNVVGTAPVDMGGRSIATRASVDLNVYDIDFGTSVLLSNPHWSLDVSAGVRIADVDQFYDSEVFDAAGNRVARGDFLVDFVGAGPRLGGVLRRDFGRHRQFSAYATGYGALLLGDYQIDFSNTVGGVGGSQTETMRRLMPVVDSELGGSWRVDDRLTLAAGWLFQGWFDFGTSGGTFDGFFSGTDDANIMSFDGLFARAELTF